MAFIMNVNEIIEYIEDEYDSDYGRKYGKAADRILKAIFLKKDILQYGKIFEDLDFSNPQNRSFVGNALGGIWWYCRDHHLPELNFMVVRHYNPKMVGSEDLPGDGPMNLYKDTFNSLKHYDTWCKNKINECVLFLSEGLLVLN